MNEDNPSADETPRMGVGRDDYDERREARIDRLQERAAKAQAESTAAYGRSAAILEHIPPGQPVLVGHHSEKRHRRDIDRMSAAMSKSVAKSKEAAELANRAKAAQGNDAISSDDPDALAKLRDKLTAMESERDKYKAYNRSARKDKRDLLPPYALRNLGANIRRVRERIEDMERRANRVARCETLGEWEIRENPETNRVELDVGRRATKDEYTALKRSGFKWSRTNEVWQRLANDSAWNAAVLLARSFESESA